MAAIPNRRSFSFAGYHGSSRNQDPVVPPALPPLDLQSSEGQPRRGVDVPSRILVVDDESGIRDLLSQALGSVGFVVACAEDGEAGWSALAAERFDLLITDHVMPRLSGLELLRRVRTTRSDLPVIVISGIMPSKETDFLQLLPPGLAVEKPFSLSDLAAKIRGLLTAFPV